MIDTHCHLTYTPLSSQLDAVLQRAKEAGVDCMISVGTNPDDARGAAELAERFEQVYFAAGLHPHYAAAWSDHGAFVAAMRELASRPKFVALGEMGLDRHYPEPGIDVQQRAFGWQLELMRELAASQRLADRDPLGRGYQDEVHLSERKRSEFPAIIHNREVTDETIAMIRDASIPGERFVFHCFTGTDGELDKILELGAMVSFTGIVTFKNSTTLAASANRVPLDRIMIETDSPYLTPAPFRKIKVNEPCYVVHTARFLAEQRGMRMEEFVEAVDGNARRFFGLPPSPSGSAAIGRGLG